MSSTDFKQQLLSLKLELEYYQDISKANSEPVKLDQNKVGRLSRMDAIQDQQLAKEIESRREQQLYKVNIALQRIEQGEYGYCFECDEAINPKRLAFDPTATLCIECASR